MHLVSAYAAGSGAVLTQVAAVGKGQELAAARAVLGQIPLEGKIVVADALLTQREVCRQIVDGGGDYLLPVKENQPTLQRDLEDAFPPSGDRKRPGTKSGGLASPGMARARGHADGVGG